MDVNAVTTLISSVGFPIAACCAIFWYMNKERESHKTEMDSMKEALNANTQVLTELKALISARLKDD